MESPVAYAAKRYYRALVGRDWGVARWLVCRHRPSLVHARIEEGNTPLILTVRHLGWHSKYELRGVLARRHLYRLVRVLLRRGADVNASNSQGETPLYRAVRSNAPEVVALLLDHGADENVRDGAGSTPLSEAMRVNSGFLPILDEKMLLVRLLLDRGADVTLPGYEGKTPLHYAYTTDEVWTLLAAGSSVDAQDERGRTPLHDRAHQWNYDAVRALLAAGAGVNARDSDGRTPLHHAVFEFDSGDSPEYGPDDVIRALLSAGALVEARDNEGRIPLHQAAGSACVSGVRLLIEAGADINVPDFSGRTARDLVGGPYLGEWYQAEYEDSLELANRCRRQVERLLLPQ